MNDWRQTLGTGDLPLARAQMLQAGQALPPAAADALLGSYLYEITQHHRQHHLSELLALQQAAQTDPYRGLLQAWLSEQLSIDRQFAQAARAGQQAWQIRHCMGLQQPPPEPPAQNAVVFSLYGQNPIYTETVLVNAQAMPEVYPGYRMRVYHDHTVPAHCLRRLAQHGVELINVRDIGAQAFAGTFWRFLALEDDALDVVLLRDADSVINLREKHLVDQWLADPQQRPAHVMRDWYSHTELILAGMWGVRGPLLRDIRAAMSSYVRRTAQLHPTHADQMFLAERIWPRLAHQVVHHSSIFRLPGSTWPPELPMPQTGEAAIGGTQLWSLSLTRLNLSGPGTVRLLEGQRELAAYHFDRLPPQIDWPLAYGARFHSGQYRLAIELGSVDNQA